LIRNEKVGCSIHLSGTKWKPQVRKSLGLFCWTIEPASSLRSMATGLSRLTGPRPMDPISQFGIKPPSRVCLIDAVLFGLVGL
ncbi:MAG: hypothetical protein ACOYNP_19590, partial [Gemmataceae bacterium]